jgi:hypothetical protein
MLLEMNRTNTSDAIKFTVLKDGADVPGVLSRMDGNANNAIQSRKPPESGNNTQVMLIVNPSKTRFLKISSPVGNWNSTCHLISHCIAPTDPRLTPCLHLECERDANRNIGWRISRHRESQC